MPRYVSRLSPWTFLSHLDANLPTPLRYSIRRRPEIGYWGLSAHGVTTKNIAGKTSNLDDNSPVKEKTPNSSGTPTSPKNGVMLTIQYRTPDGEPSVKFFKTSEAEAYDFITELKEGIPFPTLYCEGEICAFAASKIAEVRVEKTDVSEVSKGQGQKATELGS